MLRLIFVVWHPFPSKNVKPFKNDFLQLFRKIGITAFFEKKLLNEDIFKTLFSINKKKKKKL